MIRSISEALCIAAAISLVVVTFGYAITGDHTDVLMGAGFAVAVGVGVGLRGGSGSHPWTGILIGTAIGVVAVYLSGATNIGFGVILPPLLPLAVGLIDGLGRSSFRRYRDVARETFIVGALLSLGFIPALVGGDLDLAPVQASFLAAFPLLAVPWTALLIGLVSRRRAGWEDGRPPVLLILGALVLPVVLGLLFGFGLIREDVGLTGAAAALWTVLAIAISIVAIPLIAFLLGRAAAVWLRPRLEVYGQLAAYLRVMWVPIGGFAIGYLTIIFLFAGFYGTLERFGAGSFAGAGGGFSDWLSFAFFTALGQNYPTVTPVSAGARVLVGAHLVLSAGWALVLFAAVMSSIGPKLNRIARHLAEDGGD